MFERHPVMAGAEWWSAGDPTGDVGVLVVHGFSGNPIATRPLGEALAADGYTVEVARLPGHGTHWRDMARSRYADWRATVARTVDSLTERCREVVLVGHSMGGTIALDETARRRHAGRGDALSGVVAINAQILDRTEPLARLNAVLQYLIPAAPRDLAGLPTNDMAKAGADERAYGWIPAKAGYSFQRELPRIRQRLAAVDVPVLVLGSAQDHTVPPENSAEIVRRVGTSDVEHVVLERSYHVPTLDHDADLVIDRVRAFVRRVTA